MSEIVAPSAYSAAEICLDEFLDLEQFPIHDLTHPKRTALVKDCRLDLKKWGCAHIPDFISSSAIKKMKDEAYRIMDGARRAHALVNPYLTKEDTSLPKEDRKSVV